jgi:ubiquinone biosynthesis protein UbiJ
MATKSDSPAMNSSSAEIATLNIRTTSLEGRVNELTSAVNSVQASLASKIDTLSTSLSSKIEERGRPQWAIYIAGAMAVFSVYAYVDTAKIGPLKEVDARIEARLDRITTKVETDLVPLWVHQKIWAMSDENTTRNAETNRERIKRLEDQYNSTYNLRDAIQQLDSRIQHFERDRAKP